MSHEPHSEPSRRQAPYGALRHESFFFMTARDRVIVRSLDRGLHHFVPTMMIVKEPGIAAPRPPRPPTGGAAPAGGGGGGGPISDAIANRWPVLLSKAMVRAPFEGQVFKFCSTSKLVALFSLTIVIVPFPCVLKASMVAGLNVAPSELPASGSLSRIFPSFALRITNVCGGFALGSGAGGAGAGCPGVPRGGAGPTALHAAKRI